MVICTRGSGKLCFRIRWCAHVVRFSPFSPLLSSPLPTPPPQGYYVRTNLYLPTKKWQRNGTFAVPMVHSTHLIDLRLKMTSVLKYSPSPEDYDGPIDDIIVFAHSARTNGVCVCVCAPACVHMHVCTYVYVCACVCAPLPPTPTLHSQPQVCPCL